MASKISGTGSPTIVRATNNHPAAGRGKISPMGGLVRWSYRSADRVVALSNGVRKDVMERYGIPENRVVTIYNPIDITYLTTLSQKELPTVPGWTDFGEGHKILAVGKLERQKGFDLLLKALARVSLPWSLLILGEGSEEGNLLVLAKTLGLQDRVFFGGFHPNPFGYMARADLFVLSSRWEGFGHVIAEAMACGVPVLATRCPSGPDEIIEDDVDGRLCEPESVSDLAFNIEDILSNAQTQCRYAKAALSSVQQFDVSVVVKDYERLFFQMMDP